MFLEYIRKSGKMVEIYRNARCGLRDHYLINPIPDKATLQTKGSIDCFPIFIDITIAVPHCMGIPVIVHKISKVKLAIFLNQRQEKGKQFHTRIISVDEFLKDLLQS